MRVTVRIYRVCTVPIGDMYIRVLYMCILYVRIAGPVMACVSYIT